MYRLLSVPEKQKIIIEKKVADQATNLNQKLTHFICQNQLKALLSVLVPSLCLDRITIFA